MQRQCQSGLTDNLLILLAISDWSEGQ